MKRGWLAWALLAGPLTALAQPAPAVRSTLLACDHGVELVSGGAGLHEVLARLAQTLGFELRYWAADNPAIRIDTRQPPLELMRELSTHANVIARYRPDARCPGRLTIDAVWVVAAGVAGAVPPRPLPAPPAPVAPAGSPPASAPDAAQQQYLRAHGMLPPATSNAEARR